MAVRTSKFSWVMGIVAAVLAWVTSPAAAVTRFVDASAPSGGSGLSWSTAHRFLQDALELSSSGDQIWVADGTYYPPDGLNSPPSDLREASFELVDGVSMYGGFVGNESQLSQRHPESTITILSGDIDNDGLVDDDNSFHVVKATNVGLSTKISGFTIAHGRNIADFGAGMLVDSANPKVTRCVFQRNQASSSTAGAGLAIFNSAFTDPLQVINCAFLGNTASNHGGALHVSGNQTNPNFVNCLFSGNSVPGHGGAVTIVDGARATFTNCTFSGNSAGSDGSAVNIHSAGILTNCIVWGNSPASNQMHVEPGGSVIISYSDIHGGWSGTGNINADPLYCDADGVDNTVGTSDDNLRLQDGSPCLEIGSDSAVPDDISDIDDDSNVSEDLPWDRDNESPVTQRGRFFDVVNGPNASNVDMGTYENQHIAACKWDIANAAGGPPPDGTVGINDLLAMLADWGTCPGCGADFNCDLTVGSVDHLQLIANWGSCPGSDGPDGQGPQGGGSDSGLSLDDAVMLLGYLTVDDYVAWLTEASDADGYSSAQLLAVILGGG